MKTVLALAVSSLAVALAPVAHAEPLVCDYTGIPIVIALTGPVVFVCGDGVVTINHSTQVDPKLFSPLGIPPP